VNGPNPARGARTRQKLQRLLVGSELTSYSDRALDRAIMLANRFKATLRIVHVLDSTLLPARELAREKRQVKALLEREWRESPVASRSAPTLDAASGDPDETIAELATAAGADMIVVGQSNRASLTAALGGATAERVMKHTNCPVLTVKRRPRQDYATIVVALDTGASSQRALDLALDVFPDAQITILHVDEKPGVSSRREIESVVNARCAASKRAAAKATAPKLIIKSGRARETLEKEVARLNPDLLILGTHGRSGVSKLLFGSVALWLLSVAPSDVLIVRG
jgi:universal stress protein E